MLPNENPEEMKTSLCFLWKTILSYQCKQCIVNHVYVLSRLDDGRIFKKLGRLHNGMNNDCHVSCRNISALIAWWVVDASVRRSEYWSMLYVDRANTLIILFSTSCRTQCTHFVARHAFIIIIYSLVLNTCPVTMWWFIVLNYLSHYLYVVIFVLLHAQLKNVEAAGSDETKN